MLVTDNVFDYSFKVNWFDVGDKRCIWLWFQDWLIWCWWQTMCLPMVSIKVNWFDVGDRQCAWLWCQCWLIWCWWQPICLNVVSSTSRVDHRDASWHMYMLFMPMLLAIYAYAVGNMDVKSVDTLNYLLFHLRLGPPTFRPPLRLKLCSLLFGRGDRILQSWGMLALGFDRFKCWQMTHKAMALRHAAAYAVYDREEDVVKAARTFDFTLRRISSKNGLEHVEQHWFHITRAHSWIWAAVC